MKWQRKIADLQQFAVEKKHVSDLIGDTCFYMLQLIIKFIVINDYLMTFIQPSGASIRPI